MLDRLRHSHGDHCVDYLVGMDATRRLSLFNDLLFSRLDRKCGEVTHIYDTTGENWNQAFYIQLLKYIGSPANRGTFIELARRATYPMVLKERKSLQRVEALLFGTAGLLDSVPYDDYIEALKRDFEYLRNKYDITPLEKRDWKLGGRDANRPVARLAQAAVLFARREFLFDDAIDCRSRKNVYDILGVESSIYWIDRKARSKSIGWDKSDILAINVVAILQYAYGVYTQRDELRDRALTLLEKLPAESNKPIGKWIKGDFKPQNAFDTQALLQLTEICGARACEVCPIGKQLSEKIHTFVEFT